MLKSQWVAAAVAAALTSGAATKCAGKRLTVTIPSFGHRVEG